MNAPKDQPPRVSADLSGLAGWIEADRKLTTQIDQLTAARNDVRERIQSTMGDAQEARVNGQVAVRWAWTKPSTFIDKKALERDLPEIARQYSREKKPARRYVLLDTQEADRG